MAHLFCLLFGHKPTRVPFSSNRFSCRRCGLDLGRTAAAPKVPAVPPMIGKRGVARRPHR